MDAKSQVRQREAKKEKCTRAVTIILMGWGQGARRGEGNGQNRWGNKKTYLGTPKTARRGEAQPRKQKRKRRGINTLGKQGSGFEKGRGKRYRFT